MGTLDILKQLEESVSKATDEIVRMNEQVKSASGIMELVKATNMLNEALNNTSAALKEQNKFKAQLAQLTVRTEKASTTPEQAEYDSLLEWYKKNKSKKEQYEKEKSAIGIKYLRQNLDNEFDVLEELLTKEEDNAKQITDVREKISKAKKALSDAETAHEVKNIERRTAAQKANLEMVIQSTKQVSEMIIGFLKNQSDARLKDIETEIKQVDELKKKRLEDLDNAIMSEETRAEEEKRINEEADAARKVLEEKKRAEQVRQFTFEKLSSAAQAGINIAQGVTKAWAQGGIFGAVMAGVVAAAGAVQLAMILSKQPPKYAEGIYDGESHPGGWAIVGDARKHEYALSPAGSIYKTPAIPTLVDMERGTQVFPDYSTLMDYFRPEIPNYSSMSTSGQLDFNSMKTEIVSAIKNNKHIQNVSLNLDNNGIWYVANSKSGKNRHINKFLNK